MYLARWVNNMNQNSFIVYFLLLLVELDLSVYNIMGHIMRNTQKSWAPNNNKAREKKDGSGSQMCVKRFLSFKSHTSKSPPNNIDSFNILLCHWHTHTVIIMLFTLFTGMFRLSKCCLIATTTTIFTVNYLFRVSNLSFAHFLRHVLFFTVLLTLVRL